MIRGRLQDVMKKRLGLIIALFAVSLAFMAGVFWGWFQGTPYYALYQIGAALSKRQVERLLPFVDFQGMLNRQLAETLSLYLSKEGARAQQKGPSLKVGEIEVRLSPEADKVAADWVVRELRTYLKNKKNPTLPSSFALLAVGRITRKGDYALVTLSAEGERLRLGMKKEEGVWRVVELNAEDVQRLLKGYFRGKKG
jgi:hypothetical protein